MLIQVINLQEVSKNAFTVIKNEMKLDCAYSINLRTPGKYEGRNMSMGIMTIVKNGTIERSCLIDTSIFPERTLITKIVLENQSIICLNFHSLTGVDYKKAKSSNFASIASYLHSNPVDIISCDANEPKIDSIIDTEIEFYDNRDKGEMASLLFGENKMHNLVDTFKKYSMENSLNLSDGYTHITGNIKKRYDFIFCPKNWKIITSKSMHRDSINYTSDHALVETIVKLEDG